MPQVWLFQANPDIYDLKKEIPVTPADYWEIRTFRELKAGDKAILWQSGADAGVYAIGDLEDVAYTKDDKHYVDIRYTGLLQRAVLMRDLVDPVLQNLLVIRMPGGANAMRVTHEEWHALQKLISAHHKNRY